MSITCKHMQKIEYTSTLNSIVLVVVVVSESKKIDNNSKCDVYLKCSMLFFKSHWIFEAFAYFVAINNSYSMHK